MTDDFLEREREMEASDTEKKDLQEERRRLLQGDSEPESDDFSSETSAMILIEKWLKTNCKKGELVKIQHSSTALVIMRGGSSNKKYKDAPKPIDI